MKIQTIVNILEAELLEISKLGAASATHMSDEDFKRVEEFLQRMSSKIKTADSNPTLREVNASLQLLRNKSASDYIFGKTDRIRASDARSSNRGDDESRIPNFAGPGPKTRSVSSDRAEEVVLVARTLDEMGYINIDWKNENISVGSGLGAISRIRNVLQVAVDKLNVGTVDGALARMGDIKHVFSGNAAQRLQPKEDILSGQSMVKKLTPNIMAFLAQVVKQRKRGEQWHEHLDPSNYSSPSDSTGYFRYDPNQAAEELQSLGLAAKTQAGRYTLNKDAIKSSVKDFREVTTSLLSGATLQDPRNKTGGAGENEQKARQVIEFTKRSFSDRIWDAAQKSVLSMMRQEGDATAKAVEWYLRAKDSVGAEENPDTRISAGLKRVNKTILGTVIDFATAKFILRKMLFDASAVLGEKKRTPKNFVFPKDVALAGRVFSRGDHKRPARV